MGDFGIIVDSNIHFFGKAGSLTHEVEVAEVAEVEAAVAPNPIVLHGEAMCQNVYDRKIEWRSSARPT
jgi:hypothetical protein